MAVRIALCRTREDSVQSTGVCVNFDSIGSAQRALGSSRAGSFMSRRADPSIGPADFESRRERAARRGKERIRIDEAYLVEEMAKAEDWEVCEMDGLPSREKEVSGGEDISGDEQIRLDPYCVFDRYFRDKDGKDAGKDKGSRG
ncbi:E3 ubiquitin-protein ligase XB3 [Hordeum vulgare]|nr:E3 ubiquitin-protein ligase XB3 [Hordeum vulgare]